MNINVHYGIESTEKYFPGDTVSVGEVIGNASIKASLGYGDRVKGLVDGVEMPTSAQLRDGQHLHIEVRANEKAVKELTQSQIDTLAKFKADLSAMYYKVQAVMDDLKVS